MVKTAQRRPPIASCLTDPYFNIHLGALGLLRSFGLGMLAELGDVLDHLNGRKGNGQSPRTGVGLAGDRSGVHLTCLKASPSFSFPAFCAIFSRAAALLALFLTLMRQDSRHTSRRKTSRPSKAMMVTYRVSSLYASGKARGGEKEDHK